MSYKQADPAMNFGAILTQQPLRHGLEPAIYSRLELHVRNTLTDAGIAAGENIRGAATNWILGQERDNLLEAERDDIGDVLSLLNPGKDDGQLIDADPVTTVENVSTFVFHGPFDLRRYPAPFLGITMWPAQEWASATAISMSANVLAVPAGQLTRNPVRVRKVEGPSQTLHNIPFTPDPGYVIDQILVVGSGADDLDRFEFGPISFTDATDAQRTWRSYKSAAADDTSRYLFAPDRDFTVAPNTEIKMKHNTAQSVKVFILEKAVGA